MQSNNLINKFFKKNSQSEQQIIDNLCVDLEILLNQRASLLAINKNHQYCQKSILTYGRSHFSKTIRQSIHDAICQHEPRLYIKNIYQLDTDRVSIIHVRIEAVLQLNTLYKTLLFDTQYNGQRISIATSQD